MRKANELFPDDNDNLNLEIHRLQALKILNTIFSKFHFRFSLCVGCEKWMTPGIEYLSRMAEWIFQFSHSSSPDVALFWFLPALNQNLIINIYSETNELRCAGFEIRVIDDERMWNQNLHLSIILIFFFCSNLSRIYFHFHWVSSSMAFWIYSKLKGKYKSRKVFDAAGFYPSHYNSIPDTFL